ncbi:hypothetical protein OEZ85_014464 [Tetradesmus obliquus]|uniref:Minichromosome loss protein Mcl1 middle region domain-containing protein n=1 Tax=Tetradesmus obliquus TaxID=3088 RepID=A0ABY8UB41_TETOB|nr:hypothetical protein OEZ85_014464 [Tetradesmus obliquus]
MAATGDERGYVRTWQLPGLTPSGSSAATRFQHRAVACSWSRDGKLLATTGDDGQVKLITVPEHKVRRVLRAEGAVLRGLALDPEGAFVAAAASDGGLWLWEAADGTHAHRARGLAAKVDHTSSESRQPLAWHPDGGTVLAVAGRENDVVLLERLSWQPLEHGGYLAGGHASSITALAFSPNGIYLASGDSDGKVAVWMVDKAVQVSWQQAPAGVTSIAWHPQNNALLLGCADGQYGLWVGPLAQQQQQQQQGGAAGSQLPSPWQPIDDVLKEADAAAADAVKVDEAGDDDDELAELEDEDADGDGGAPAVIKRRGLKSRAGAPAASSAGGAADSLAGLDDLLDDLDAAAGGAAAAAAADPAGRAAPRWRPAPPPPKPQAAVHPCSTPAPAAGCGAGGRFLAYNSLGCVVSKAVDDHHVVEVTFHDTAKHRARVPTLTDFYDFFAAALGPRGVAYISAAAGPQQPSMLVYRCFESWTPGSDWSVALPEGEEAAVVAAGSSVVAVATSRRLLRLYSHAGRQLAVLGLQGQPVAAATPDPGHLAEPGSSLAASRQHLLGLVWAAGPPVDGCGTQQLQYAVYDVSRAVQCCCGPLVLSPGASLAWLGFSREGLLAAMDSAGVLRLRSPEWGGAWVQHLDAPAARAAMGSEAPLWPAWLEGGSLMAVVNSSKAPHPQVSPRPLITPVPLGLPGAPADAAPGGALEEEGMRLALAAAAVAAAADAAEGADDAEALAADLAAQRTEADKAGLRLFNAYLKAGRQGRALEAVGALHHTRSIEGALKLANHHHLPSLAERISAFLEQRLHWEDQQQQQQALLAQQQHSHEWAAAGDDMQTQQDQHDASQATAADAPAAPKAGSGGSSGGGRQPGAAMFGAAAGRAGTAAASAAGQKRKPAGIDAALGSKAGGGGNPFARKKAAK